MGREVLEGLRVMPKPAAPIIQENQQMDHCPSLLNSPIILRQSQKTIRTATSCLSVCLSQLINLVMNSRACCSLRARACVRDADISRDLQSFFLLQGLRHRTAANAELLLVLLLLLLLPTPMMLPLDLTAIRSGTRNILDGDC